MKRIRSQEKGRKRVHCAVYFTEDEYVRIKEAAKNAKLSISYFITKTALEAI